MSLLLRPPTDAIGVYLLMFDPRFWFAVWLHLSQPGQGTRQRREALDIHTVQEDGQGGRGWYISCMV